LNRTGPGRPAWRLIVHDAGDGAWNLAVDEALAESYSGPEPLPYPTLRLYGWSPPALSLGRSQPATGSCDPAYLRREGIDLVRRPTGGGAVLHEHERTYAVAGRLRADPFEGGVLDTYRRVANALAAGLRHLALEVSEASPGRPAGGDAALPSGACFARPSAHEITCGGLKLVGSAQWRSGRAFLQHGSIPFRADPTRLARAVCSASDVEGYTDLERSLGHGLEPDRLDEVLVRGFEESFAARFEPGELTPGETERANRLRSWKYLSADWTLRGRRPG